MEKIAEYQNDSPIINVESVSSRSRGNENIAQVFGQVREAIGQEYVAIQKEASSASLLQSQMSAEDIISNAQLEMVKNPYNAEKIAQNAKVNLSAIKDSAVINKEHHAQLDYSLHHQENQLKLHAAEISFKRARSFAASQAISSQGDALQKLYNTKDPEEFKSIAQNMIEVSNGLLASGSITPSQHSKMVAPVKDATDRYHALMKLATSSEEETPSAVEANKVLMNPGGNNILEVSKFPTNETANQIAEHTDRHMSYSDITSAVDRNELANVVSNEDLFNLSPEQFYNVYQRMDGVHNAVVKINSLEDWRVIENRITTLNSNPNKYESEKGELAYLQGVQKQLQNGEAASVFAQGPRGAELELDYQFKKGILNQNIQTEDSKAENKNPAVLSKLYTQERQLDNNLYQGRLAIQAGAHVPWNQRTPFTQEETFQNRQVFATNQNPLMPFQKMDNFNQTIGSYFANSMKEKGQQQLLTTYNLQRIHPGFNIPEEAIDISKAQQPGLDKSGLIKTSEEGGLPDEHLKIKIQNSIDSDLTSYLLRTPQKDPNTGEYVYPGSNQIAGVVDMCKKYVEYKGITTGDFKISNHQDYIDTCVGFYQKGYNLLSNSDGSYNLNQGYLSKPEWDNATYFVKEQIREAAVEERGELGWEQLQDRGGIYVTVTDDNHIIGQDYSGKIIYNKPFSAEWRAAAHHAKLSLEAEAEQYTRDQQAGIKGIVKSFEDEVKGN